MVTPRQTALQPDTGDPLIGLRHVDQTCKKRVAPRNHFLRVVLHHGCSTA